MNFTALKATLLAWIRGVWGKTIPALKAEPIATFGLPLALAGALLFSWAFGDDVQPPALLQAETVELSIAAADLVILFGNRLGELESAVADMQRAQTVAQPSAPALVAPRRVLPAPKPIDPPFHAESTTPPVWGSTDLDRAISAFPSTQEQAK